MKLYVYMIDLQYFGNINYYKNLIKAEHVIFEQYDMHKKRSFVNRTVIAGANGRIVLSVPLVKGRSQKTISRDLRIANEENWQMKHWRSIISSYNNSPWFKYFSDNLAVLFLRRYDFLVDWNLACFEWTINILKLDLGYELTTEWKEAWPGVRDIRFQILPEGNYHQGDIRYPQVFENKFGFMPGLCILDLICCEGPKRALSLLKADC